MGWCAGTHGGRGAAGGFCGDQGQGPRVVCIGDGQPQQAGGTDVAGVGSMGMACRWHGGRGAADMNAGVHMNESAWLASNMQACGGSCGMPWPRPGQG